MTTETTPAARRAPRLNADGWLAVSALVLGGVLALLWTNRPAAPTLGFLESAALANPMVAHAGGVTMMTTDSGTDEILVVLDVRTESMLVYRVDSGSVFELLQRASLPQMFVDAKAKAGR